MRLSEYDGVSRAARQKARKLNALPTLKEMKRTGSKRRQKRAVFMREGFGDLT